MKKKIVENQGNLKVLNQGKNTAPPLHPNGTERLADTATERLRLNLVEIRICSDPLYRCLVGIELQHENCIAANPLCHQLSMLFQKAYVHDLNKRRLWQEVEDSTALQKVLLAAADAVDAGSGTAPQNAPLAPVAPSAVSAPEKEEAKLPERKKTQKKAVTPLLIRGAQSQTAKSAAAKAPKSRTARSSRTAAAKARLKSAAALLDSAERELKEEAALTECPATPSAGGREGQAKPLLVLATVEREQRNADPQAASATADDADGAEALKPVVAFPADEIVVTATGRRNPQNGGLYCTYLFEPTDEGVRKAIFGFVSHSEMAVDENCTIGGRKALRMRYRDPLGLYSSATSYGRTRAEKWYNMGTAMGLTRYFNLLREGCTRKPGTAQEKSYARLLGSSQTGMKFEHGKCLTPLRCTRFELRNDQPWNVCVETADGITVLLVEEGKSHSRSRQIHALLDARRTAADTRPTDPRWDSAFSRIEATARRAPAIAAAASCNGFLADPRNRNRLRNFVNALPE